MWRLGLLLVPLLCSCKIPDAEVARLRTLGAESRAKLSELDDRRRAEVAKLAADPNQTASPACPAGVELRPGMTVLNFERMSLDALPVPNGEDTPTVAESRGLRISMGLKRIERDLSLLGDATKARAATFEDDFRDVARPTYWCPYEIDFVIKKLDAPKLFFRRILGGIVEGRVIVWNWQNGTAACWGDVAYILPDVQKVSFVDSEEGLLGDLYRGADESALEAIGLSGFPRKAGAPLY